MQVILLIIIGVFLIYRMMRVEDRMNKVERDMEIRKGENNEDLAKKKADFKQFRT
jgi:flagellar biogenesis protein FliO